MNYRVPVVVWDDFRYFLAVVRAGSLNAAAGELGVDHSTVGRRIRDLEGRLGTRLLDRRGNGLTPTPQGWEAVTDAERMEEAAQTIRRRLTGHDGRIAGQVSINVSEGLGIHWLVPRLLPFQRENPDLIINLRATNTSYLSLKTEVDLAIWWVQPTDPQIVARKLGEISYSLFAMPSYVERYGVPKSVEELHEHRILHFSGYEANPGLQRWNDLMKRIPPAMRAENTTASQGALASGQFMALLPDYSALVEPNAVRFPVDLSIRLEVWVGYHEDSRSISRVRAVAAEIGRLADGDRGTWFK